MGCEHRRQQLLQHLGADIAIVPTAPQRQRNSDVLYPYRPDSDFYFLTHFAEPEAIAVFAPGAEEGDYILFVRDSDPDKERWDGHRAGVEGAVENYHADIAFPIAAADEIIPKLMKGKERVHSCLTRYTDFDEQLLRWIRSAKAFARSGIKTPAEVIDIGRTVHPLRLCKQDDETQLLREAARISAQAHVQAMQRCQPGMMEYQIQAEIEYQFRKNSCEPAYPSIVASGSNACILHYIESSRQLGDGDLILIDAGAELDCYAADITRTYPVNGTFSDTQKQVYEVVLEAQRQALEAAIPGNRYSDVDAAATQALTQGLIDLKILDGTLSEALETKAYRPYYMHRIGHWLGLDVHDVGDYHDADGASRTLEPGMYMTIEPGLYFSASDELDEKWHDIGVRIEDDVLITADGYEVTTEAVPKSVADIEHLMSS